MLNMMKYPSLVGYLAVAFSLIPMLACGPAAMVQVTPTPTKTPKIIEIAVEPMATNTPVQIILSTATPTSTPTDTPTPLPTDTPTPEPPTETPTPELPTETPTPLPTNTSPPPPPPTYTPIPTDTPIPLPTPTPQPPPPQGPSVIIELPDGDTYNQGDSIEIEIKIRDPAGVATFTWGFLSQNRIPMPGTGGTRDCHDRLDCDYDTKVKAILKGQFEIGVEAINRNGQKTIETKQIYIG